MNTNVRITLTEEQRKQYKDVHGESATRNNIKMRVATMFFSALGLDKPKSEALKNVNLSEKAKEKIRAKMGVGKKKMVLKK